jgi:hypothetical protein
MFSTVNSQRAGGRLIIVGREFYMKYLCMHTVFTLILTYELVSLWLLGFG